MLMEASVTFDTLIEKIDDEDKTDLVDDVIRVANLDNVYFEFRLELADVKEGFKRCRESALAIDIDELKRFLIVLQAMLQYAESQQ